MSTAQTSLSTAADDRKARLAKLASLKRKAPGSDTTISQSQAQPQNDTDTSHSDPHATPQTNPTKGPDTNTDHYLSGRNYNPSTRAPKLGFESSTTLLPSTNTVEAHSTVLLNHTLAEAEETKYHHHHHRQHQNETDPTSGATVGLDLLKLRPKKPNWDLKRELEERNRRYDVAGKNRRAVALLVRERVKRKSEEAVLSGGGGGGAGAGGERQTAKGGDSGGDSTGIKKDGDAEGEEVGIEGAELVEGVKMREREDEEDREREREDLEEEEQEAAT